MRILAAVILLMTTFASAAGDSTDLSKYPPAEPVALRLLPLKGAFSQPSEAKERTKAKASYC